MSQPNPKFNDFDYTPAIQRRGPAPITPFPVNALSGDADPTRDLRALIEQLQHSAREARNQAQIAESEREQAIAQLGQLRRQNEELRSQSTENTSLVRERDNALAEVERLGRAASDAQARFASIQREISEVQRQREDLVRARDEAHRQLEALTRSSQETTRRLTDVQGQLISIRQARDAAQAQNHSLLQKIASMEERRNELQDRLETAEKALLQARAEAVAPDQLTAAREERDAARQQALEVTAEIQQLRAKVTELTEQKAVTLESSNAHAAALVEAHAQIATLQRTLDENAGRSADVYARIEQLTQERSAALIARDEAITSLSSAQKQIERVIRERDLARQQSSEQIIALEAQVEALLTQLNIYEGGEQDASTGTFAFRKLAGRLAESEEERRELAARLDLQRNETIDLGAQLQAAQEQIRELSASLAEARLQVLSSNRLAKKQATSAANAEASTSKSVPPGEVFDPGTLVTSIRQDYQAFLKNPAELHLLSEIAGQAQVYAELARTCGLAATHRVGSAFAGLAQELFHHPERVEPMILRTVQQGIEFLATLPKLGNLAQAKDPSTATVYAVDDDPDNCECICMAMETAGIQTVSVNDPSKAMVDLASTPCDLIFLDVSMPGMDGFELCTSIRNMALHMNTPVIFLTGLTTAENRVQSNMSGGNEFIGKPYLLSELTLKSLMLMMKAQLHLA